MSLYQNNKRLLLQRIWQRQLQRQPTNKDMFSSASSCRWFSSLYCQRIFQPTVFYETMRSDVHQYDRLLRRRFTTVEVAKEDTVVSARSSDKKGKNIRQIKQSKSSNIQLLIQLQGLHSRENIQQHFYPLAKRTHVAKMKWMSTLAGQLIKLQQSNKKNKANAKSCWDHTQMFFKKQLKQRPITTEMKSTFWDLIVVPSNKKAKRKKLPKPSHEHISLFQKVRESAIDFPLIWSQSRKRKINLQNQEQYQESNDRSYPWKKYLEERSEKLSKLHDSKTSEQQLKEATRMVKVLQRSLPPGNYERLIRLFQNHVDACKEDHGAKTSRGKQKTKKQIRILYTNIRVITQSHIHLIAPDLADFLYVNVLDDPKEVDASNHSTNSDENVVSLDPRIVASQKEFESIFDEFVDSFEIVQKILWKEFQLKKKDQMQAEIRYEDTRSNDLMVEDDDSEESILESFNDATEDSLETVSKKSKTKKENRRKSPRQYMLFEAMTLEDKKEGRTSTSTFTSSPPLFLPDFPSESPNDRLVIVDNLPIDISENYLLDAFSRCGPIESVTVFNRRPHLDPGRRSTDSRKKIRNPSAFRQQWHRPRTPLYAMILFENAHGATKATVDPLRIFGMVLDRHLVRSYPSKEMTKLYLEDISEKYDLTSIEYNLSKTLDPELYVCLDIDSDQRQTSRRRQRQSSSSCVIQFPNFEAAYWSYLKLSTELKLLEDDDCVLQWMKTPHDAMLYWTRKLNF